MSHFYNLYYLNKQKEEVQPEPEPVQVEVICGTFEEYYSRSENQFNEENLKSIYDFMTSLGWIYDTSTCVWFKPGWLKDNKGNWNLPKQTIYNQVKPEKVKVQKTIGIVNNMARLRKKGYSYRRIADNYNMIEKTVQAWVTEHLRHSASVK